MMDDLLKCEFPVASLGLFLPFSISISSKSTDSQSTSTTKSLHEHFIITIVPLLCNPNPSSLTNHEVLSLRAGLTSVRWHPHQHQTTGYIFSLDMNTDGPKKKEASHIDQTPVCSMSNLDLAFGSYLTPQYKELESLQKIVTEAALDAIEEDFDDNIPLSKQHQLNIKSKSQQATNAIEKASSNISMNSILIIISQIIKREELMNYFADALYEKMKAQSLTDDLLSALCASSGNTICNSYMKTIIMLQKISNIRVHLHHSSDAREYMAQTLNALGCFDDHSNHDTNCAFESYKIHVLNEKMDLHMTNKFFVQKQTFLIHQLGALPAIAESKISKARTLYDLVSNIGENVYYSPYMECIKVFHCRLTYDIFIDVRNQLSLPAAELSNMASKLLQNEPLNACIGANYIVGHQMLQMIMYYLYDVKQDRALFSLLKSKVVNHVEDDVHEEQTGDKNILDYLYNLSKVYTMVPGDDPLGLLCEAFDVNSGSMQAQQWSTEYSSGVKKSNHSHVFNADDNKLLSKHIYLPQNEFLTMNFTWSEQLFSSLCSALNSPNDLSWDRKDTTYMIFLMRFCYSDTLRRKVLMYFDQSSRKLNAFNDTLFARVMNISYTAYLSTIWKWCEKQSKSMFAKMWNDYRFRRQLGSSSQLPDIKVSDLKFGVQLQVGMKTVLMLPLWLLDIAQDEDCRKKAQELTDSCNIILSRSNRHIPFKSFITNWGYSESEYECFQKSDSQSYVHLNLMMNVLCAFQSCLSTLKTDDWKESMATEVSCVSDYPKSKCKGSECVVFSSMNRAFYHFVRMIMMSEVSDKHAGGDKFLKNNNSHEENPLRFFFDHFHNLVMQELPNLEEGKTLSIMMGRLSLSKLSLPDCNSANDENKVGVKKRAKGTQIKTNQQNSSEKAKSANDENKVGIKEMQIEKTNQQNASDKANSVNDENKEGVKQMAKRMQIEKTNHQNTSEKASYTVEDFIEKIKQYYKLGNQDECDLPKIDGQEMVPLIDIKNVIMMCCSNSPNSDGSISIVTVKSASSSSRTVEHQAVDLPSSVYEGRDINNGEVTTCSRRGKRTLGFSEKKLPKRKKTSQISNRDDTVQGAPTDDSCKENLINSKHITKSSSLNSALLDPQNHRMICPDNSFSESFNINLAAFGLL